MLIVLYLIVIPTKQIKNLNLNYLKQNMLEKNTNKIPIFTFHRLVSKEIKEKKYPNNQWVGSITIFEDMIKYLYDNGYKTISNEEFYNWYIGKVEYDKKTVMITIDDGYYEDYYLVYPIIKKYNFKATSFVVGSRIKEKTNKYNKYYESYIGFDIIHKVRNEYPFYEFQSHSFNMHYFVRQNNSKNIFKIKTMSFKELEEDTLNNKKFNFTTMAYPFGSGNKELEEILKNQNYIVAYRFVPSNYATRNEDRYAIPRIKINGFDNIDTLKKWLNY